MTPLHAALAATDAFSGTDDRSMLVKAKVRGLLRGYDARWIDGPYIVDGVEEMVTSDLWNPDTGRKSRSFQIAGKLDVTGWCGGRTVLIDHKTTADTISDPAGPYWRQLVIEAQASHYMLLMWLNGRKVDDAVWDVVKKPGIRPASIAKKDQTQVLQDGVYCGATISMHGLAHLRETGREDLELYEARLAYDCTIERPDQYFQRRSVPRMDSEISEWAKELWGHSQDMLNARREDRWPRNSGACMNYGRPCVYLGVCSGMDTIESDKWRRKDQVHNELVLDGDGRDVLTNSRIKVFQTCRRKEYYQYEVGVERQDEEEAESLYFGTLWHSGLEAWWLALKDKQHAGQ